MATRFGLLLHHICRLESSVHTRSNSIPNIGILLGKLSNCSMATATQKGDTRKDNDSQDYMQCPGLLKVLVGNPKRLKRIKFLGELFKAKGFELRIAGGAVRDMLRGKAPKDIDFATTATPDQTLEIVSKHEDLLRIIVTAAGQRHGTVAVKFKTAEIDFKRIKLSHESEAAREAHLGGQHKGQTSANKDPEYDEEKPYEITTLRCDKVTDGRHAEVEFISDWRVDAERRDLTINAMFLTLDDGQLVDFFGGESDLKHGVVRFVGDAEKRIQEDYLRILRYFRFWSRYSMGKQPDEETLKKLSDNLEGLSQISGERIWEELKKTLSHLPCYDAFELMLRVRLFDYVGLLDKDLKDYDEYKDQVLSEVKQAQDNIQKYLEDVLNPKLKNNPQDSVSKHLKDLVPVIIFAAAIQNDTFCINAYKRFKFSNKERDTILYIIANRDSKPSIAAIKCQIAMSPASMRSDLLLRITAFLISRGLSYFIDELVNWKVPQFPKLGNMAAQAVKDRRLRGDRTNQVLEAVKLDWAKDDYKTDEATLKKWIETKLDAMVENNKQT